ncbi:MAG: DNA starvation/stationary phase protection protein [Alphaproteobacteria bacterium]|jgi:starvation-inducible DNA-binding protein|nr:DNA starvation/stationary phase protection protein [Alphaproteobacteria bacterium]
MSNPNTKALAVALSNTFVLYVKTLNYHWHIKGENFYENHLLLENHYNELAESIDSIAERIVIYGEKAPATMAEFLKLATIKEADDSKKDATTMIMELAEDRKNLADKMLAEIESKTLDPITEDVLLQQVQSHTKAAWMLKSCKK